jgi:predicted dehydrogenase
LRNFRRVASVPLAVDPRADALAPDLQREFPDLVVVSELNRFLDDPALQAAVIASPPGTHYDLTRQCLEAGKDVFVEKPFALSSAEARELVTLARLRDRILMVGHKYLFHPAIARLKAELDERAGGACRALIGHRLGWGVAPDGMGALWHLGSHEVSIFQHLLGETAQDVAATGVSILGAKCEDLVTTILRYPSGAVGIVQLGLSHPEKVRRLFAIAEAAAYRFDDLAEHHKLTKWENLNLDVERPFDERTGVLEGGKALPHKRDEPVLEECRHFLFCLQHRLEPRGGGEAAVAVVRTLEALSESLRDNGRVVSV